MTTPDIRFNFDNRYNYHKPFGNQAERYEIIRNKIRELAVVISQLTPVSPEQTRCFNALDEAMF